MLIWHRNFGFLNLFPSWKQNSQKKDFSYSILLLPNNWNIFKSGPFVNAVTVVTTCNFEEGTELCFPTECMSGMINLHQEATWDKLKREK